tara:strand:+ start:116 stop:244 length:129 start_codon:yes stop_codon:yes gene_type:complete
MKQIKVREILSGGMIKRKANSNKELGVYLKVLKLMKRFGIKI